MRFQRLELGLPPSRILEAELVAAVDVIVGVVAEVVRCSGRYECPVVFVGVGYVSSNCMVAAVAVAMFCCTGGCSRTAKRRCERVAPFCWCEGW